MSYQVRKKNFRLFFVKKLATPSRWFVKLIYYCSFDWLNVNFVTAVLFATSALRPVNGLDIVDSVYSFL